MNCTSVEAEHKNGLLSHRSGRRCRRPTRARPRSPSRHGTSTRSRVGCRRAVQRGRRRRRFRRSRLVHVVQIGGQNPIQAKAGSQRERNNIFLQSQKRQRAATTGYKDAFYLLSLITSANFWSPLLFLAYLIPILQEQRNERPCGLFFEQSVCFSLPVCHVMYVCLSVCPPAWRVFFIFPFFLLSSP